VIVATAVGKLVTVIGRAEVENPHALLAVTEIVPELDPIKT
jgi:hypothetical protein